MGDTAVGSRSRIVIVYDSEIAIKVVVPDHEFFEAYIRIVERVLGDIAAFDVKKCIQSSEQKAKLLFAEDCRFSLAVQPGDYPGITGRDLRKSKVPFCQDGAEVETV